MEQGDFHEKARGVLDPLLLETIPDGRQPQPSFCCWMAENPANGGKDVTFHLDEGAFFIRVAASSGKLLHSWHAIFGILELGRDP